MYPVEADIYIYRPGMYFFTFKLYVYIYFTIALKKGVMCDVIEYRLKRFVVIFNVKFSFVDII